MPSVYRQYSDVQLVNLLSGEKQTKEAAFAELYERYSQRIYAYCLRIVQNSDDAKDVYQETFVKFFNSVNNTDRPVNNVGGYLLRIARNLCLNHKRDKKEAFAIEEFHALSSDAPDYERKELILLLEACLERLEVDYREAFILREYQGLSYSEMSDITGDSISALKNRVWRAKEKIKSLLKPYLKELS